MLFDLRRTLLQADTLSPSNRTTSAVNTRVWISFGQLLVKRWNKGAISDSTHLPLLPTSLYSVLRANNTSAPPSSTPPESKPNIVPLAVGLTLGLLTLVIVVIGGFYLRRRRRRKSAARARRRKSALLDTSVTPLHLTPLAQGDKLSGTPQESKLHSQSTQPPTHDSTLSSSAPTATAVPIGSFGLDDSEIPPSYESHMRTARVAQLNN